MLESLRSSPILETINSPTAKTRLAAIAPRITSRLSFDLGGASGANCGGGFE